MIVKNELVKKVRHFFNLNIYEAKVWLALLNKAIASASEIAELSGVPRSRTYDVLESLEKQGFVMMRLGKPIKYIAVKPAMVIDKLKNNAVREAEEKNTVLSNLKETKEYTELEMLYKTGIEPIKASDLSGALKGRSEIYSQLKDMVENAKNDVVIVTSIEGLKKKLNFLKQVSGKLQRKGVKLKIGVNASEEEIKEVLKDSGIEAKTVDVNARFCLIDGKQLMFMVMPHKVEADSDVGIWINSDYFVGAMKTLTENIWK